MTTVYTEGVLSGGQILRLHISYSDTHRKKKHELI